MYKLRLYVAGKTAKAEKSFNALKMLLEDEFKGEYELEVIDVLTNPQLAEDDKVFATPTAVRLLPPPIRKVIGDLNTKEKVVIGLDLKENHSKPDKRIIY